MNTMKNTTYSLGYINPKRIEDIDHFYVKKENGLYWLCHQHRGEVEKALYHLHTHKQTFL